MMIAVAAKGFVVGLGLIAPFGLQNTWILNHGIRQHHHLVAAAICAGCDVFLISLGVFGNTYLQAGDGKFALVATVAGILFLGCYSIYLLFGIARRAFKSQDASATAAPVAPSAALWVIVAGTLMVTLLNPHVLVERIVLLGSISTDVHLAAKLPFAVGAIFASFVWFAFLSGAAARVGVYLSRPSVRLALDSFVALMLTGFTIYLYRGLALPGGLEVTGLFAH